MKRKLAVVFPGMGYHKDKPLLYYASKLVKSLGYEVIQIEYGTMPEIVFNQATLIKAGEIAYESALEQLKEVPFHEYEDVLFIGKSIGTVVLSKYASDHEIPAREIWYTPVAETFSWDAKEAIAFIGEADPASDVREVKRLAEIHGILLYCYPDCNHSLECGDVDQNIDILRDVMKHTTVFVKKERGQKPEEESLCTCG